MKIIYTPEREKYDAKVEEPKKYSIRSYPNLLYKYNVTFLKVPEFLAKYVGDIKEIIKGFFISSTSHSVWFDKDLSKYKAVSFESPEFEAVCFPEKFSPYFEPVPPPPPQPTWVLKITTKATSGSVWLGLGSQFDQYLESETGEVRNGYFYPNSYGVHIIYLNEYQEPLRADGYPVGNRISELEGVYPETNTYPSRLYYGNNYINKVLGNFFLKNNGWTSGTSFMFYHADNLNEIGPILKGCNRITNLESFLDYTKITRLPDGLLDDCVNLQNCKSFVNHCYDIEYVPPRMFDNCPNITMNNHFFENCYKLEYLDLGNLHRIDETFCQNCYKLQTVILRRNSVVPLNNRNAFANNASGRCFYVPDDLVNSYKSAMNWNYYSSSIRPLSDIE